MKTLILMRHSHAVSNNPAYDDFERPLTEDGLELANRTAKKLADYPVTRIICSSATRTMETAAIVQKTLNNPDDATIVPVDSLYHAGATSYLNVLGAMAMDEDDCVVMVGHNPAVAQLVQDLSHQHLPFSPASVAIFRGQVAGWNDLSLGGKVELSLVGHLSDGDWVRKPSAK